jgi:hypothetical protein
MRALIAIPNWKHGLLAGTLTALCAMSTAAAAETAVLYSNLASETRPGFGRNATQETVWDDLGIVGGGLLSGLTLVVNNSRPVAQPGGRIKVEFRRFDATSGGPLGSPLGSVTLDLGGRPMPPGNTTISSDSLAGFGVVLPVDEVVAVGVRFDDPTLSFGVVTFDPPTVGTSSAFHWVASDPTPRTCEGVIGRPVNCNFGWELRSSARPVNIDIDPAQRHNPVRPDSQGQVWVAILSSPTFDPLQVDLGSARFGPDGARVMRHRVRDINHDGTADLLLAFRIPATGIECGDTQASLAASTYSGVALVGADTLRTIGCRKCSRGTKPSPAAAGAKTGGG